MNSALRNRFVPGILLPLKGLLVAVTSESEGGCAPVVGSRKRIFGQLNKNSGKGRRNEVFNTLKR